jgi:hypothetical protein
MQAARQDQHTQIGAVLAKGILHDRHDRAETAPPEGEKKTGKKGLLAQPYE